MPSKYKVFGLGLTGFIILWLWLALKPKTGIDYDLFEPKNIDSIRFYKDNSNITIIKQSDINAISSQLKKSVEIKPDRIKVSSAIAFIYFYTKKKRSFNSDFLYLLSRNSF